MKGRSKSYTVTGRIVIEVKLQVDAQNEEEALENAEEILEESYGLDVDGEYHSSRNAEYDLEAYDWSSEGYEDWEE